MDMLIVWAVVIAAALLLEFVTYDFVTSWFAGGGLVALILTICGAVWYVQIIFFFLVSLGLLIVARPFVKKFTKIPSVPTNAEANIGQVHKIVYDVVDGRGAIKINGVICTVICDEDAKVGQPVKITGIDGNKYIVKKENI